MSVVNDFGSFLNYFFYLILLNSLQKINLLLFLTPNPWLMAVVVPVLSLLRKIQYRCYMNSKTFVFTLSKPENQG